MYYLITEKGVHAGRTVSAVTKASGVLVTRQDFAPVGRDHLARMTDEETYTVRSEMADLEKFALGKLFKPDPMQFSTILQVVQLVFLFILLVR